MLLLLIILVLILSFAPKLDGTVRSILLAIIVVVAVLLLLQVIPATLPWPSRM